MKPDADHAVVILAPLAGDASALRALVEHEGARARSYSGADEFYSVLDDNALTLIVTEEGLARCALEDLAYRLSRQPAWSDVPMIVLADAEDRKVDSDRFSRLADVGNVTLLTRPTTRLALVMALRSAIRTRRLQFAVRDQLRELADHATRLKSLVEERTRLLEHEVLERRRIEQTLAEARRLESLGRLTGGIAHDFNNILQVVAGSETLLRMLLASTPDTRVTRALDGIRRATSHGATLTQQLLAYARRQPLASVVLDMQIQLGAAFDMIQRMLDADVRAHLEAAPGLWSVFADPAQLDAALLNIVGNARDAMPQGGVITLHARNWTLPDASLPEGAHLVGEFVGLLLTDDGHGMTEETARQAFEPFFTTKSVGKGTGLGLSQVYGFAIQSHGLAFIRREANGTTVGMLLPRSRDEIALPDLNTSTLRADGLAGLRILYVEDDADVAESTIAILQSLGASVKLVDSADAARASDLAEIDVVFSDVMMPGEMDGVDLARWLAQHRPALPVVLTSGFMLSPERLHALDVQFVRKPFVVGTVNDAIIQAVRRHAGGRRRTERRRED